MLRFNQCQPIFRFYGFSSIFGIVVAMDVGTGPAQVVIYNLGRAVSQKHEAIYYPI